VELTTQEKAGAVLGRWTITTGSVSVAPSVVTETWTRGRDSTVATVVLFALPLPNAIRCALTTVLGAIFDAVTACFANLPGGGDRRGVQRPLPTLCFGSEATA
jgi:hypothetical protein